MITDTKAVMGVEEKLIEISRLMKDLDAKEIYFEINSQFHVDLKEWLQKDFNITHVDNSTVPHTPYEEYKVFGVKIIFN